jgi:ribose/xylose/arabinose/galactoside ABC-type transport system permease subunit
VKETLKHLYTIAPTVKKEFATLLLLVVLWVIVTALNPRFLSMANLQNTASVTYRSGTTNGSIPDTWATS